jgi:hypothetical protein
LQWVTQRLLAQRPARECSVKVSEDELLAKVRTVAADEWEQARRIESNRAAKEELTCSSSKPATTSNRTGARPGRRALRAGPPLIGHRSCGTLTYAVARLELPEPSLAP